LSPLDDEANSIADLCTTFWDSHRPNSALINGAHVERWILKLICGISADGSAHGQKAEPSPPVVRQLFGLEPMPERFAFYCLKNVRVVREWNRSCWHRFFKNNQTGEVDLGVIVICGLPLMAYVGDGDPNEAIRGPGYVGDIDVSRAECVRRPSSMVLQDETHNELRLSFSYQST